MRRCAPILLALVLAVGVLPVVRASESDIERKVRLKTSRQIKEILTAANVEFTKTTSKVLPVPNSAARPDKTVATPSSALPTRRFSHECARAQERLRELVATATVAVSMRMDRRACSPPQHSQPRQRSAARPSARGVPVHACAPPRAMETVETWCQTVAPTTEARDRRAGSPPRQPRQRSAALLEAPAGRSLRMAGCLPALGQRQRLPHAEAAPARAPGPRSAAAPSPRARGPAAPARGRPPPFLTATLDTPASSSRRVCADRVP